MQKARRKPLNPWPVAIIVFFAVAICAAVAFVIFCTRQPVELVAADYYEQELRYQDQLDRMHRAASLDAPLKIAYNDAARRITISLPPENVKQPLKGWIHLYRPSAAGLDQKHVLQFDSTGAQDIDAAGLSDGLWRIRVSWNFEGADYYCDQKVVVGSMAPPGREGKSQ